MVDVLHEKKTTKGQIMTLALNLRNCQKIEFVCYYDNQGKMFGNWNLVSNFLRKREGLLHIHE